MTARQLFPGDSDAEISLDRAPVRTPLVLGRLEGSPEFLRRLSALGLRRGSQVSIVQATVGGGRIVAVSGARVAMGRSVLAQLYGRAQS